MRRMLAGTALLAALALGGAGRQKVDHAYVFGGVTFFRGSGAPVAEYRSGFVPCSAIACEFTVPIGKRDYGRFLKWCGSDNRDMMVAVGSFGNHVECQGPNPWTLQVDVGMHNASDVLTTHTVPVSITVKVTP